MLRSGIKFYLSFLVLTSLSGLACAQSVSANEVTAVRCWSFPARGVLGIVSDGRDVFATLEGGKVLGLSSAGEKLWETDLGGSLEPGISLVNRQVRVRFKDDADRTSLKFLSPTTGVPADMVGGGDAMFQKEQVELVAVSVSKGSDIIFGDERGFITSKTGDTPIWKFRTGGQISGIVAVGDDIVALSRDNFVYCLSAKNGGLRWKRRLEARPDHFGVFNRVLVISALDQHGAWLVNIDSGRLVGQISLSSDETVNGLAAGGNILVVASADLLSGYSLGTCGEK